MSKGESEQSLQQGVQGDNLNDFIATLTGGGKLKQHAEHDTVRKAERQINKFTRNVEKNRFSNAVLYTQGAVTLKEEVKEDQPYIHASRINCLAGPLILAQAPMESTLVDFCRLLWQQNVTTIVTLCDMNDKNQCYPYFEKKQGKKNTVKRRFRFRTVAVRSEGKSIVHYELKFENWLEKGEKKLRTLNVISVLGWTPEAPFSAKTLVAAIHNVEALKNMDNIKENALLIHGTTGIRRTGCFALAYMFSKQILVHKEINLIGVISAVRELRYGVLRQKNLFHLLLEAIVYLISETGVIQPGSSDQRHVLEVIKKASGELKTKGSKGRKDGGGKEEGKKDDKNGDEEGGEEEDDGEEEESGKSVTGTRASLNRKKADKGEGKKDDTVTRTISATPISATSYKSVGRWCMETKIVTLLSVLVYGIELP